MATCFFVKVYNDVLQGFDYLVTAKHTVRDMYNAGDGFVRLNSGEPGDLNQGVTYISIPNDDWLFHDDQSVDIAVRAFAPKLEGAIARVVIMTLKDNIVDGIAYVKSHGGNWPPLEGEEVLFVALMTHFPGVLANQTIVRRGSLALITDEQLPGEYGPSDYYAVESQIYPGNSGAPVWALLDVVDDKSGARTPKLWLLGVVTFAFPAAEELQKKFDTLSTYLNLGIGLVTPIEKVVDILEKDKARRDKGINQSTAGMAVK